MYLYLVVGSVWKLKSPLPEDFVSLWKAGFHKGLVVRMTSRDGREFVGWMSFNGVIGVGDLFD